jgi:hypothetical protein
VSEPEEVRITGTDIASAGEKLHAFAEGLQPGEQAVIRWLLQRAAEAPEAPGEVQGYLGQFSAARSPGLTQFQGGGVATPMFNSLGVSHLGYANPGQLAGISATVGVGVSF